jgi:YVTN family beta-propeller protein
MIARNARQLVAGCTFLAAAAVGAGCFGGPDDAATEGQAITSVDHHNLAPVATFHEAGYVKRSRPKHVELTPDGKVLFVALEGNLIDPANEVLALDAASGKVLKRITVGSSPQGMALSRDGTRLYVANQFSDYLSVIDVAKRSIAGEIAVTFYAQDIAVSEDGKTLYLANRWLDAVEVVSLDRANGAAGKVKRSIPVAEHANPRNVVVGPGGLLYVGNVSATSVSVVDPRAGTEIDRLYTNSPINGVATDGRFVYAATLGRGDGHGKEGGVAAEHGNTAYRGDSTASKGFSDINNDVIVIGLGADKHAKPIFRYTSDTAEVSKKDAKGDYTAEEMIVQGALPEQAVVHDGKLYVTMSSSDQVQIFDIDAGTGALRSAGVVDTGINPFELAVSPDGTTIYTADRLGETVSKIDVVTGERVSWNVGVSRQAYPANEYEQGEMLFHSAKFSSEALPSSVFPNGDKAGDKSCNHCHRETMTDGKVWTVGIGKVVPLGGERMPPAARNIRDTLPLFWEGVQTKEDFDLESNEFSPPEDFACDPEETEKVPEKCAARDAFFMKQVGHTFREVGRHLLGEFLVGRPRLLPNPNHQFPSATAKASIARGKALFFSKEVGCFNCHPSVDSNPEKPFTINETIPQVISQTAFDSALKFKTRELGTFNVPSLRGAWDRPAVFFHDGRAKSIRSAILPPEHAALQEGRDGCQHLADNTDAFVGGLPRPVKNGLGCNMVDGKTDIHGTTSKLRAEQVDDLVKFVLQIE